MRLVDHVLGEIDRNEALDVFQQIEVAPRAATQIERNDGSPERGGELLENGSIVAIGPALVRDDLRVHLFPIDTCPFAIEGLPYSIEIVLCVHS